MTTQARSRHWLLVCSCVFLTCSAAYGAEVGDVQSASGCPNTPAFYSQAKFRIAHVKLESPFDFLHKVRDEMHQGLKVSKIAENDVFSATNVSEGRAAIRKRLLSLSNGLNLPLDITVVLAEITNCRQSASPPTLDVVFRAFTSRFEFHPTRTFETRALEQNDPATAAGIGQDRPRFTPVMGYDRSSRLFGGARTALSTSAGKEELEAVGSSSAMSLGSSFSGERSFENGRIQKFDWRTGYQYSDAPFDLGHLAKAGLTAQFSATTRPVGKGQTVIRFGGSVTGGHEQSTVVTATLPPGTRLDNSSGELKTYAGVSLRSGRQSFKASVGLKLGQTDKGGIDYAKFVADTAYEVRFLPKSGNWNHRPIELELRLTAGLLQNRGVVPLSERFIGGNANQDFLIGDTWRIRSAPYIRSIPANRLNRLASDQAVGGDRFFSFSSTLGITTWRKALVPEEIRSNRDFQDLLNGEMISTQSTLQVYWSSKDPAIDEALKSAPQLDQTIKDLRSQFTAIEHAIPDALASRFSDCDFALGLSEDLMEQIHGTKRFQQKIALSSFVEKDGDGSIDQLTACIADLKKSLGEEFAASETDKFNAEKKAVAASLANINAPQAEEKARQDMVFVRQTVGTLLDEINFWSISPVCVFDAARIGPQPSNGGGGVRFGIGGGVRMTMLSAFRITVGYALNPNPRPWEGRGAAFFSMDILALFR